VINPPLNRIRLLGNQSGCATRFNAPLLSVAAVALWVTVPAQAGLTSANYRIEPTAFSGGASHASSANYSAFSGISSTVVGTSTSADYTAHYGFFPSAGPVDVTGRFAFYNRSAFDGGNAAANAADDNAIATDKAALRSGTATFANYTSYSRGLNGILVDVPNGAAPTASDFTFKRGNNNSPLGWAAAPVPSSITVRPGAGVGGADRVTLIWPDNTIQKGWLQITVLSTANTGLSMPDTFYFGNAIGETGTSPLNALVGASDESGVRANPRGVLNPAPVTFVFDMNRDRLVGAPDVSAIRANPTGVLNALRLIQLGAGDAMIASVDADLQSQQPILGIERPGAGVGSGLLALGSNSLDAERYVVGRLSADGLAAGSIRVQEASSLGGEWRDVEPQPDVFQRGEAYLFKIPAPPEGVNRFFRVVVSLD